MDRLGSALRVMVIFAAGIAVGAAVVTPATGHVSSHSHLWSDHIKSKLSGNDTINQSNNPVNWEKLKDVPSDISDGKDDDTPDTYLAEEITPEIVSDIGYETFLSLDVPSGNYAVTVTFTATGTDFIADCTIIADESVGGVATTSVANGSSSDELTIPATMATRMKVKSGQQIDARCNAINGTYSIANAWMVATRVTKAS